MIILVIDLIHNYNDLFVLLGFIIFCLFNFFYFSDFFLYIGSFILVEIYCSSFTMLLFNNINTKIITTIISNKNFILVLYLIIDIDFLNKEFSYIFFLIGSTYLSYSDFIDWFILFIYLFCLLLYVILSLFYC